MAETPHHGPAAGTGQDSDTKRHGVTRHPALRFGVWLVLSAAFLGFVVFGSVDARIWRSGQLYFQERGVAHVWGYFGRHLPELPAQSFITVIYYLSVAVMIGGSVLGLWMFLQQDDTEPDIRADQTVKAAVPDHG